MRINITARHFKLTEELKTFAEQEVYRLKKYYEPIIDCEIILGWQKQIRIAEIKIAVYGTILSSHEQSEDMNKSIITAVDKLERQIQKYKHRLRKFDHDTLANHSIPEENEPSGTGEK